MDLYIQELGSKIYKEKNHFVIATEKGKERVAISNVETLIVQRGVLLSSDFLLMALDHNLPVYFADYFGNVTGRLSALSSSLNTDIQRKQLLYFSKRPGRELAQKWIYTKIKRQKEHALKILNRRGIFSEEISEYFSEIEEKILNLDLEKENFRESLQGIEGIASRYYYSLIQRYIPKEWNFKGRKNYKATDPYNVILNYLFGVLYTKINHSLILAGLDEKIGILHGESRGGKALLYDFVEKYRFLVWELTFTLFSRKLINHSYFDETGKITTKCKKVLITEFYKKIKAKSEYNKSLSFEELWKKEAKDLAKEVLEYEDSNLV